MKQMVFMAFRKYMSWFRGISAKTLLLAVTDIRQESGATTDVVEVMAMLKKYRVKTVFETTMMNVLLQSALTLIGASDLIIENYENQYRTPSTESKFALASANMFLKDASIWSRNILQGEI